MIHFESFCNHRSFHPPQLNLPCNSEPVVCSLVPIWCTVLPLCRNHKFEEILDSQDSCTHSLNWSGNSRPKFTCISSYHPPGLENPKFEHIFTFNTLRWHHPEAKRQSWNSESSKWIPPNLKYGSAMELPINFKYARIVWPWKVFIPKLRPNLVNSIILVIILQRRNDTVLNMPLIHISFIPTQHDSGRIRRNIQLLWPFYAGDEAST